MNHTRHALGSHSYAHSTLNAMVSEQGMAACVENTMAIKLLSIYYTSWQHCGSNVWTHGQWTDDTWWNLNRSWEIEAFTRLVLSASVYISSDVSPAIYSIYAWPSLFILASLNLDKVNYEDFQIILFSFSLNSSKGLWRRTPLPYSPIEDTQISAALLGGST